MPPRLSTLLALEVAPDLGVEGALTRRGLLGGIAVAALLSACSSRQQSAGDAVPATRRFEHAGGVSEVPVDPQRVVSLHSTSLTWQLANLGVDSIGTAVAPADDPTTYLRLVDPAIAERLDTAGIESVDGADGPDLERIAGLQPDLIVGGDWHAEIYDRLRGIAPTVLVDSTVTGDRAFGTEAQLAALVGREAELERQLDAYEARVRGLRERFRGRWAELTWAVVDEIDEQPGVALVALDATNPAYRVLTDLGARPSPAVRDLAPAGEPFAEVSPELVSEIEADVTFVSPPYTLLEQDPSTPISDGTLRLLAATAAGRRDQVLAVGLNWTNASVASYDVILDDLERFLADRGGFFAVDA